MGYTHYYRGFVKLSDELLADVEAIIEASSAKLGDGLGEGEPVITATRIDLNGWAGDDEDHETFRVEGYMDDVEKERNGVNNAFVKTARKPYDEVVCAVLLRIGVYNSRFKVSSDGNWDDWTDGRELYQRVFGVEAQVPNGFNG